MTPLDKAGEVGQWFGAVLAALLGLFGWRKVQEKRNGRSGLSVDVDGEPVDFAEFVRMVRGMETRLKKLELAKAAHEISTAESDQRLMNMETDLHQIRVGMATMFTQFEALAGRMGFNLIVKQLGPQQQT